MIRKAPISCCFIARDEEPRIEAAFQSIRDYVKEMIVIDTGSVDGTVQLAKKYADIVQVYTACNNSENGKIMSFSEPRNVAFSLATQPWILWFDADDTIAGSEYLLEMVEGYERAREGYPAMVMFPYEYSYDAAGNCNLRHYRERLISPKDSFKWVNRVHEVIVPDETKAKNGFRQFLDDRAVIKHNRHNKPGDPFRNLRILKEVYAEDGEKDPRQMYYLGLEYANTNDRENSNKILSRYTEITGWDDEKFMACTKLVENHQAIQDYDKAIYWALKAIATKENWFEGYFWLATCYYFQAQQGKDIARNYERAIKFFKMGLECPPTQTLLFIDPNQRKIVVHHFLNTALGAIGRLQEAIDSIELALKETPNDTNLQYNLRLYKTAIFKGKIIENANQLQQLGIISPTNKDLIKVIIETNPNEIGRVRDRDDLSKNSENQAPIVRSSGPKDKWDMVFFIGQALEQWNAESINKGGIGGSETAVIEMGKLFAADGHRVRVFGDCIRDGLNIEGTFDGVEYLDHTKFRNLECDILVASRRPDAVDFEYNVRAISKFLWVHDIHCGNMLTASRGSQFDKIFVLSEWHKQFMAQVYGMEDTSKLFVTKNGIDLKRFDQKIERNPHRAIYSSSPDRGLEVLLRIWPRIKERVPDAELHIFYGFENWEKSVIGHQDQINLINKVKQLIKDNEKLDVKYHGRVAQDRLAKEFLKSGILSYLTWFSETSCQTAMEAQAAGCRIITSPIAALNETVGDRGVLIPGDWLSGEYQDRFVEETVKAMNRFESGDREELQKYARENFSWSNVFNQWKELFDSILNKPEEAVLIPYKPFYERI